MDCRGAAVMTWDEAEVAGPRGAACRRPRGGSAAGADLDRSVLGHPGLEGGLAGGGGAVDDRAVPDTEGAAVPGADDAARGVLVRDDAALVEGARQVAAPVREDVDLIAVAQDEQPYVTQAAVNGPAVREVFGVAEVVPAELDQVRGLVGVAGAGGLTERQVPAQIGARQERGEAREAEEASGGVAALPAGYERRGVQGARGRHAGRVDEPDALLLAVQRRPVRDAGEDGRDGAGEPRGDERLGGAPRPRHEVEERSEE